MCVRKKGERDEQRDVAIEEDVREEVPVVLGKEEEGTSKS